MPRFGFWKPKKKNVSRMSLDQLTESQLQDANPLAKLTAANKRAVSRRAVAKRKAKSQLLDLSKHGTVVGTGLSSGELAVAARWVGQDYIVTRARFLPNPKEWPEGQFKRQLIAEWRSGTRFTCTRAIAAIGYDFGRKLPGTDWHPNLALYLESLGVVRLVPHSKNLFKGTDTHLEWAHAIRDGIYDVFAGMKLDKNGDPVWKGDIADDEDRPDHIPIHYNQVVSDGHGVAMVYRFRREFIEALPHLLPTGS